MAKVKKYSKKFLCLLSAGVFFIMALFYPLEDFKADVVLNGTSVGEFWYDMTYNYSNVSFDSTKDVVIPPSDMDETIFGQYDNFKFFYYFPASGWRQLITTSKEYYAYRFVVESYAFSSSSTNVYSMNYYIGTQNGIYNLDGIVGEPVPGGGKYWLITDFADGTPVFMNHLFCLYEYSFTDSSVGSLNFRYPSLNVVNQGKVTMVGYTVSDLTDEIYSVLTSIYSNNQLMLSKLNDIYSSLDTVESKLQSLVSLAQQVENNTDELEGLLKTCNSYLSSIQSELEEQTTWLEKIYDALVEFLGLQGDDSVEEMPDDDMDNMLQVEDELLGDASADDLEDNLTVTIDVNSSDFIWDTINRLITSNSLVFGGFISILSLGIVALILGR